MLISQGSGASERRVLGVVGSLMSTLLQRCCWLFQWKRFLVNRSEFYSIT